MKVCAPNKKSRMLAPNPNHNPCRPMSNTRKSAKKDVVNQANNKTVSEFAQKHLD